jgi:hypothetical protein
MAKLTKEEKAALRANRTPAMEAALKAKNDAKKAKRLEYLKTVLDFVHEFGTDEVKLAARYVTPKALSDGTSARISVSNKASRRDFIIDLFGFKTGDDEQSFIGSTISEDAVWSNKKMGRMEMRHLTIDLIKKAKTPAERVWVSFDLPTTTYTLVALGADKPSGWIGYVPTDILTDEAAKANVQ